MGLAPSIALGVVVWMLLPGQLLAGSVWSMGSDRWATGNAVDIDYASGDFLLKDKGQMYTIIAESATVQLPGGRFGRIPDVKQGCYVRVRGEQLSARTIYASLVIVLDETGSFQDLRPETWLLDQGGLLGNVIWISAPENRLAFRVDTREYVVIVNSDTIVTRATYRTDILSISTRDRIIVLGAVGDDARITAERIAVVTPGSIPQPGRHCQDVVTGSLVSSGKKSLTLRTLYGVRDVALAPSADLGRLSDASRDKEKPPLVTAHGRWNGREFAADRIEVSTPTEKTSSPK